MIRRDLLSHPSRRELKKPPGYEVAFGSAPRRLIPRLYSHRAHTSVPHLSRYHLWRFLKTVSCLSGVLLHSSTKKRSIYTKEKGGRSRWSRSSVSGEDGEMNRVGDGLSLFSCPQRGKNGGVSARGTKSSFQASSAKRTGTGSSRQRVRCHKKTWQVVLEGCWTVGESALHFLLSGAELRPRGSYCFMQIYLHRKETKKKKTKP